MLMQNFRPLTTLDSCTRVLNYLPASVMINFCKQFWTKMFDAIYDGLLQKEKEGKSTEDNIM